MERYICIHGHFYQPPRENPWLEAIEAQDSAYPYHDWNERITAECYAPERRLADSRRRGPDRRASSTTTPHQLQLRPDACSSWMEATAPEVYQAILAADRAEPGARFRARLGPGPGLQPHDPAAGEPARQSARRFSGGSRISSIVSVADREGMWLPETAVDTGHPGSSGRARHPLHRSWRPTRPAGVRHREGRSWRDVSGGKIDPHHAPIESKLPSGRRIALFFYDGPISRAVAFEGLLARGETFADRLVGAFSDSREWPQLVHIATDGETYGHHHRHGDMALAYALQYIEAATSWRADQLRRVSRSAPARATRSRSSRTAPGAASTASSAGGATAAATPAAQPTGIRRGARPLREALDWLRDELAPRYRASARPVISRIPWEARNDYIDVILDRSPDSRGRASSADTPAGRSAEREQIAAP